MFYICTQTANTSPYDDETALATSLRCAYLTMYAGRHRRISCAVDAVRVVSETDLVVCGVRRGFGATTRARHSELLSVVYSMFVLRGVSLNGSDCQKSHRYGINHTFDPQYFS